MLSITVSFEDLSASCGIQKQPNTKGYIISLNDTGSLNEKILFSGGMGRGRP